MVTVPVQVASIMGYCSECGVQLRASGNFCSSCGARTAVTSAVGSAGGAHYSVVRGFSQIFGIHPAIAFLTLVVDVMLFGGETVSLGTSLPLSAAVAAVLGFIAYKAQMKWYGDDKESAAIKALILALLTAIPTALPALLYVPAGILGFFSRKTA